MYFNLHIYNMKREAIIIQLNNIDIYATLANFQKIGKMKILTLEVQHY